MSGNVRGLGYKLENESYCNTQRGGCGARIRWGMMFGKKHPFNRLGLNCVAAVKIFCLFSLFFCKINLTSFVKCGIIILVWWRGWTPSHRFSK